MQIFDHLNTQQKKAIEAIEGPVLVVAGPGTGKTQIISQRIINILDKTDTQAENILCLTFTDNAATNMRKRLLSQIGTDAYKVKISTFHSFCNEVITDNPTKFQKHKELVQIDDITKIKIIHRCLDNLSETKYTHNFLRANPDKYFYTRSLMSTIETFKKEGMRATQAVAKIQEILNEKEQNPQISKKKSDEGKVTKKYKEEVEKIQKALEAAEIYKLYEEELEKEGLYDFHDMIIWVIDKFREDNDLLLDYQEKYQYILVDEYQDTNGAQNQILFELGRDHPENKPNIFVVGDDDQSIFQFQGANVGNLVEFQQKFDAEVITVDINYRSTQKILDIADAVIAQNQDRLTKQIPDINKKLKQGKQDVADKGVKIIQFNSEKEEISYITKEVQSLISEGINPDNIAILYRKHTHVDELIEKFLKNKIPLHLQKGRNALDEPIIRGFISLLKVVNAQYTPDLDAELIHALSQPYIEIKPVEIFQLNLDKGKSKYTRTDSIENLLEEKSTTLLEKLIEKYGTEQITIEEHINPTKGIKGFLQNILNWQTESKTTSAYGIIQKVAEESGFLNYIFTTDERISLEDISSVNSFFEFVKQNCKINKNYGLAELLTTLDDMIKNGIEIMEKAMDTSVHGVNFMTVHSSKGLEFEYVFLYRTTEEAWEKARGGQLNISLPDELFGSFVNNDNAKEEVRRLFFVALTRAESALTLTYANTYPTTGGDKSTLGSELLSSIPPSLATFYERSTSEESSLSIDSVRQDLQPLSKDTMTIDEEDFLRQKLQGFKLSPSSLNTFLRCPLQFKMESLLKLPSGSYKDNFNMLVGNAVHAGLEAIFRTLKKGEPIGMQLALWAAFQNLERNLLTVDELKQLKSTVENIFEVYFKDDYASKLQPPVEVEKFFGYSNSIQLYTDNFGIVELAGKVDKIELSTIPSESGLVSLKVVDYKTSRAKSLNEIKGTTKSSEGEILNQLIFYKLLVENDSSFRVNGRRVEVAEFEVLFVNKEECKSVNVPITQEEIQSTIVKIGEVSSAINNLKFGGGEEFPLCGECVWCQRSKL